MVTCGFPRFLTSRIYFSVIIQSQSVARSHRLFHAKHMQETLDKIRQDTNARNPGPAVCAARVQTARDMLVTWQHIGWVVCLA